MEFNSNTYAVIEPSILPTEVKLTSMGEENGGFKQSKTVGVNEPYVSVNNYSFSPTAIVSFKLTCSGKIPSLAITLDDTRDNFSIDSFPRDGDVLTFLLSSKNESTFKSIHMDFDILKVSNLPTGEAGTTRYVFSCKTKVPLLDSEECRYYETGTSLSHLQEEAKYLGLGMVTNIDGTADDQIRIQPYISHSKFITNIVESSYISDNAFQLWFIDQYYYLNFIDVNRIFNSKNIMSIQDAQDSLISYTDAVATETGSDDKSDNVNSKLVITNHFRFKGLNNYINTYSLENNSFSVVSSHGHFRDVQVFDDVLEGLSEFTLDPLTSENLLDSEEPLRGRRDEERYLSQVKHKYVGRQDAGEDGIGNVHQNYAYSKIHNHRNNLEASKMKLIITLASFNPSLYKYQKVPVIIYAYTPERKSAEDVKNQEAEKMGFNERQFKDKAENEQSRVDSFLSGNYIIENIDYSYNRTKGIIQTVTLIRREWPTRYAALL